MKHKTCFILLIFSFIVTVFVSCGLPKETKKRLSEDRDISPALEYESRMDLEYAQEFAVDRRQPLFSCAGGPGRAGKSG